MKTSAKAAAVALLSAAVLFPGRAAAQRPPETAPDGTDYLRVNINPTFTPPLVNINPGGLEPRVEVSRMPDVRLEPVGCDDGNNFETRVADSIQGPMVVTYLSAGAGVRAMLDTGDGSTSGAVAMDTALVATAVYLRRGTTLRFDGPVLYSGCRPARS